MLNFIVNPNALHGKQSKFIEKAEERLNEAGAKHHWFFSEKKGMIGKYAKSLSAVEGAKIIAVGGDGTLNEVLSNLVDPATVQLGLIPAGTGNDFAAAANIPKGLKALDLILETEPQFTDYIECGNGVRSMNIAGLGMDVDILERCARKKHGSNKGKYFRSLLSSLVHYRGLNLEVTVNGETQTHNALIAAVCNGKQFGGGIPFCPAANIEDGLMDLVIVECPKRYKLPFELIRLMRGKILEREITHHILCERAVIVPETAGSAQFDGEILPAAELRAEIVSGKLRMFRG